MAAVDGLGDPPDDARDFRKLHEFPPPAATVHVEFGADTRRGRGRRLNADHYSIIRLGRSQDTIRTSVADGSGLAKHYEENGYAMVVADGSGPGDAGEAASRVAIQSLMHLVRVFGKWNLRIDDAIANEIMERAERFYRHVDGTLVAERQRGSDTRLQTALTATFGAGRDLFFAHVGHSRAYLLRDRRLMPLTRDHTVDHASSRRASRAPLVDVTTASRDLEHLLTDTLGMAGTVGPRIDIERFQLDDGDVVLVCTNGVTDAVDEDAISGVLSTTVSADEKCRSLVERAAASGAEDDATAVIAQYRIPG
jgi:serine/threonine protein phosphatase PrpC